MQGLISNLIRPFRFKYSVFDLGPKFTDKYEREDCSVLNDRGFRIQYSYFRNKAAADTCLVYAHCNSGCRIQGLQFVQTAMNYGWNLCLFDFVGSGISDGEYISLGYYECMDLQAIISVMLKQGNNKINLWGRSMGAATIIMYLSQTKQIDTIVSCVLDSPYCSLWKVVKQFGRSKTKIPEFIVEHVMEYIRRSIIKDHQFDIKQMDLLKKIHNIDLPMMFIASTRDSFVNCSHAAQLYKWAGSKQKVLEYIQKQHNSPREANIIQIGMAFLAKSLVQKQQKRKQLRILSKKKQFCRRMTGNNMAQLITKPIKKTNNTQTVSTGNLARFNSFCANNISRQKVQQYSETKITKKQIQKPKINQQNINITNITNPTKNKNPHTIQQSIIKLVMPPKQVLQRLKNTKQENRKNSNIMNATGHLNLNCHVYLNNKIVLDKENNLNISNQNKKQNLEEDHSYTRINSQIKNFSSIITKRFHFDSNKIQTNLHDQRIFEKQQTRDRKSKTQKISKLYVKQNHQAEQSPTRIKSNGIKLFKKITHQPTQQSQNQHKRDKIKSGVEQRVKTEVIHTLSKQSSSSSEEQHLQKIMSVNKHMYNSYSEISGQEKQRQSHPSKWCGKQMCLVPSFQDLTKQVYINQQYLQQIKRQSRERDLSYNEIWDSTNSKEFQPMSQKMKLQLKHFSSIGDLPSACQYNDVREGINRKQSQGMQKTQKIIKIQLDRSLLRGQKSKQCTDLSKFTHNSGINLNINMNKSQFQGEKYRDSSSNISHIRNNNNNIQMNPIISKFKMKNRKLLKINCNQNSNHSLL